jgi:ribosomal protein L37E
MVFLLVVGGGLVLILGVASTIAAYTGLLGAIGAGSFARCQRCGHLGFTTPNEPVRSCPSCRHGVLMHPLHAVRHAVRVDPFHHA